MSALLLFAPLLSIAQVELAQVEATKCGADIDCPNGAICEQGVCTIANPDALEAPPAPPPPKVQRKAAPRTYPDGSRACRRHRNCPVGQECFKRRCGPQIPSNGLGLRIAGWVVTGLGLAWGGLAGLFGVAQANSNNSVAGDISRVYSAVFGVASGLALASGIPMLIVGYVRRAKFKRWLRQHHPSLAVIPTKDSGTLAFSLRF